MKRPYCVGLTGGVGSGKSTAARLFAEHGAALVDTDAIAHGLTAADGAAMPAIAAAFGDAVIAADGGLDRAAMRARVFAEGTARARLEQILHPLIHGEARRQVAAARAPYVILIVPLLVENLATYRPDMDRIAVVDCDEQQQIERTASRPGISLEQARSILAAQSSRAARLAIADDLIDNRSGLAELEAQVTHLHQTYLIPLHPTQ
ncbi:MAG: dephospho-CoA kinase [Pseudomonadota bacterium]|nr:dephospho-CoA kinase [Pseudomonadota bacterium]MDP1903022.1 dephospho-CoA kinase [Pseudomonadota bacterium]MDP2352206.1 dephospho-CoA kinase [Pseudomonadota bacterium]